MEALKTKLETELGHALPGGPCLPSLPSLKLVQGWVDEAAGRMRQAVGEDGMVDVNQWVEGAVKLRVAVDAAGLICGVDLAPLQEQLRVAPFEPLQDVSRVLEGQMVAAAMRGPSG